MQIKASPFFILIMCVTQMSAQTIKGFIYDRSDSSALYNAAVYIKDQNTTYFTDGSGAFIGTIKKLDTTNLVYIRSEYQGYFPKYDTIFVSLNQSIKIYLKPIKQNIDVGINNNKFTLTGIVINKINNHPVKNGIVEIKELDISTPLNDFGKFTLYIPSSNYSKKITFQVYAKGYSAFQKKIRSNKKNTTILLSPKRNNDNW